MDVRGIRLYKTVGLLRGASGNAAIKASILAKAVFQAFRSYDKALGNVWVADQKDHWFCCQGHHLIEDFTWAKRPVTVGKLKVLPGVLNHDANGAAGASEGDAALRIGDAREAEDSDGLQAVDPGLP